MRSSDDVIAFLQCVEPEHVEGTPEYTGPRDTAKQTGVAGSGIDTLAPGQCLESSVLLTPPVTAEGKPFAFSKDCAGLLDGFELEMKFSEVLVDRSDNGAEGDGAPEPELEPASIYAPNHIQLRLKTRCRARGQSMIFHFQDADGSVQQAGVVHPPAGTTCGTDGCPVLVNMHGTGISASDSADGFKRMKPGDTEYTFGLESGWLLAPSRHGAHNWEGVGQKTVIAALDALGRVTAAGAKAGGTGANDLVANVGSVLVAGHSMGGHGAWLLAVTSPDRVRAVNPNAGWLCKEFYGDSNTAFLFDSRLDSVDHRLRAILAASVAENCATSLASNLRGTGVYARVGSEDKTVPPWFSRRMMRIMSGEFALAAGKKAASAGVSASSGENNAKVVARFDEIPGKEHWWWDTKSDNDGGAVNDGPIRDFFAAAAASPAPTPLSSFVLTVLNPAAAGSMQGWCQRLQNPVQPRICLRTLMACCVPS